MLNNGFRRLCGPGCQLGAGEFCHWQLKNTKISAAPRFVLLPGRQKKCRRINCGMEIYKALIMRLQSLS